MIDSFQERSDLHVEAQLAFFSYFFAFLFPIPSRECILAEVIALYQLHGTELNTNLERRQRV